MHVLQMKIHLQRGIRTVQPDDEETCTDGHGDHGLLREVGPTCHAMHVFRPSHFVAVGATVPFVSLDRLGTPATLVAVVVTGRHWNPSNCNGVPSGNVGGFFGLGL